MHKFFLQSANCFCFRQSFDGHHIRVVGLNGEGQAAPDHHTVNHDAASAANTMLASKMRTSQFKSLPEHINEMLTRLNKGRHLFTVQSEADRNPSFFLRTKQGIAPSSP